jgi:hypothetical protein
VLRLGLRPVLEQRRQRAHSHWRSSRPTFRNFRSDHVLGSNLVHC